MKIKYSRLTALTAVLSLICTTFFSCAEADYQTPNGNHKENSFSSQDYITEESYYTDETIKDDTSELDASQPSSNEEYKIFKESGVKDPYKEPLSTFSADVDTASYSNVRRLIEDAKTIPEGAVRIEEFINYFDYNYPEPQNNETFSSYIELADCPWNNTSKLMMIGLQGMNLIQDETPPSNIVFLIDSSGSMSSYNKLPLVQSAFSMLADNLTENDRISIVTYANTSTTLIKGAKGNEKDKILEALYSINAGGGTNGEGGIETAYDLAEKYFIRNGNNRVIIATDGDLNIGVSSGDELIDLIKNKRDNGVYLSVLGFGTDNIKDSRLEALADNGNGNYSYIDSIEEAQRVLVKEMTGLLHTIAKDVKIQVEFNPSQIKNYRLIGYDNRIMDADEFFDTKKDAGEVGAGHSVTALYEIQLADSDDTYDGISLEFASEHKYNPTKLNENNSKRKELCKLSITYKEPDGEKSNTSSTIFGMEKYSDKPSENLQLAAAVTEFAMLLKDSQFKGNSNYKQIIDTVSRLDIKDEKIAELFALIQTASTLYE